MAALQEHPTVKKFYQINGQKNNETEKTLDADWLREFCLACGAEDVGFVEIERAEIAEQKADILAAFPRAKTLISFVCRMNREPVRSAARSVANLEFHHAHDKTNEVAHKIVAELEKRNIRAINPSMGFPMEMSKFPGKIWVVSHKPVAVAAGLGQMGINRNVIHPVFGNFILLGTIITEAKISRTTAPIDYNPCLDCKLCVAACPVGAIGADGDFSFSACVTHNYREFLGGFTDWVETIADSDSAIDYRKKVTDAESASMWQSLSYGANYKAAYCMAVCPAGEDVIAPFLENRKEFLQDVLKPLQEKEETIYVVKNSDAERHVKKRFPHKTVKQISNGIRPRSIAVFLARMSGSFARSQASGLDAVYHFVFTGEETIEATVTIKNQQIKVENGLVGAASLKVTADSATWLGFLAKEKNFAWAVLTGKIRFNGSPKLLLAFGKCFPS